MTEPHTAAAELWGSALDAVDTACATVCRSPARGRVWHSLLDVNYTTRIAIERELLHA